MKEQNGNKRRVARAATIALMLALGAGNAIAEEPGECYKAGIPAPIVLPDGSLHPAGELRICMTRRLSPVEWLHVIYVGGEVIGAFRGHDGRVGHRTESAQSKIVLLTQADGSLQLFGFTTSDAAGARLHRLIPEGALMAESNGNGDAPKTEQPGVVALAAARR